MQVDTSKPLLDAFSGSLDRLFDICDHGAGNKEGTHGDGAFIEAADPFNAEA